jgi:hypothetical protein
MPNDPSDPRLSMLRNLSAMALRNIETNPEMTPDKARYWMEKTRQAGLAIFKGHGEVFDRLFAPRFERAIHRRFGAVPEGAGGDCPPPTGGAAVIPDDWVEPDIELPPHPLTPEQRRLLDERWEQRGPESRLRLETLILAALLKSAPGLEREVAERMVAGCRARWRLEAPDQLAEFDQKFAPELEQVILERFGRGPVN